ncbi:MAG: CPBP family intramembrane metalloprotease [Phycisphaeraceae bacterium]|nr:CPBP family intramembrane metalloprotease [Phycisphaeraceae bacterium]
MKSRDLYSFEKATGWLPWGLLAPVIGLAMVVVTAIGGTLLLTPIIQLDTNDNPVSPMGLVAFTLVPFGLLLAVLLLWVRFVEGRSLASIGLTGRHKPRVFLKGVVVGVVMVLFSVGLIWLAGGYSFTAFASAWSSPGTLVPILLLLAGFALQSSVEEILFRGWLLSVLSKKFNVPLGVLISSALFTLLHFHRGQPLLVTSSTFLFALFCCAWALRTGNILGVMGWHAGWNWLIAVGFGVPLTGMDVGIASLLVQLRPVGADWLTGGADGPESSAVTVAMFVVCTIAIPLLPGNRTASHPIADRSRESN